MCCFARFQDDVDEGDLCGAACRSCVRSEVSPEWHGDLVAGLISIPEVMPGDTVFWHTDICHAVGDEHAGREYASVIYIGSAPDCAKNRAYLPETKRKRFSKGVRRRTSADHGLRGQLQGSRDREGFDGSGARSNGLLSWEAYDSGADGICQGLVEKAAGLRRLRPFEDQGKPALQGIQERKESLLIFGGEFAEAIAHVFSLAAVTFDGVSQGQRP